MSKAQNLFSKLAATLIAAFLLYTPVLSARGVIQGYVQKGGTSALTSVAGTSAAFMRSFPGARVTVYRAGTSSIVPIYSNISGTAKANPFTSDSVTGWFSFFADDGSFRVQFDLAGIPSPYSWDNIVVGSSGVSYSVTSFGATCDGSAHDDTSAIQTAFNVAGTYPTGRGAKVQFPVGVCKTTSTLTLRSSTTVEGVMGGLVDNAEANGVSGSVIKYAGGTGQPIVKMLGAEFVSWRGVNIDGSGIASCTGILIDSANTPASHTVRLSDFTINNVGVLPTNGIGIQIGTSGGAGDYQSDGNIIEHFKIQNTTVGILIDSYNAMDYSQIRDGFIYQFDRGIWIKHTGFLTIASVAFGSNMTGYPTKVPIDIVEYGSPILISQIQMEGPGSVIAIRHVPPATANYTSTVTVMSSQMDAQVQFTAGERVVSIGNHYATGFSPLSASGSRISSIGDQYDAGIFWTGGGQIAYMDPAGMSATAFGMQQSAAFVAALGDNNNVQIGNYSNFRITAPGGAFAFTGFGTPAVAGPSLDGRILRLYAGGASFTLKRLSGSSIAGNKIETFTGGDVVVTSLCELQYDLLAGVWLLVSYR